jgi:flagellar biosynthesis/type III secretory pathway chaperone
VDATEKAYKSLAEVLEDEIKIYRAMLDVVRREKDVLISADIKELEECNLAKEAMVIKVRSLERLREKYARELGGLLGLHSEFPRLLELASKMLDPAASKLRSVHSTMDLLVKRIKEFNSANEELVQSSLKTVNGALGAIKETLQPKVTYAPSGEVKKPEVAGHFVSKDV